MRKYFNTIWLYVVRLQKIVHTYSIVTENIVTDSPFTNSNNPFEWLDPTI